MAGPESLRALDDPEHLERPRGWDGGEAADRLDRLVARLERDFGVSCASERNTQDSSEYGRVVIRGEATACGMRIVVCLSAFGRLALTCAENPGAYLGLEEAVDEGALDVANAGKVERALTDCGYVVVAEELLQRDYDGPSTLPSFVVRRSWWDRYFGNF